MRPKNLLSCFSREDGQTICKPLKWGRFVPAIEVWQGVCTILLDIRTFIEEGLRTYEKAVLYLKQYSALLALASLLWIVPSVSSQEVPPHTAPPSPPTDITRQELASFDSFLDSHPEMGEQLRRNPSLVDDREYVKNHPELQAYLQDHPGVERN